MTELQSLDPGFVSVTMGAGGSNREETVGLVTRVQSEMGVPAVCHLPCIGFEISEIANILDRLVDAGISNLLALGGDPPHDDEVFQPPEGGFTYARELIEYVRSEPDRWAFTIGSGCYPEVHPRAPNAQEDLNNLKRKVDAGTDFLITQLFFNNADYHAFVDKAQSIGIHVPIVPGIMPIVSISGIRRMAKLSGARIPSELSQSLARAEGDDKRVAEIGIDWATKQCQGLLEGAAVSGLHFYTLNRASAARRICSRLFE